MTLRDKIESNPSLIILGAVLAGYLGGIGTTTFLEGREEKLRESLITQFQSSNEQEESDKSEIESSIRDLLIKYKHHLDLLEETKTSKEIKTPMGKIIKKNPNQATTDPIRCINDDRNC